MLDNKNEFIKEENDKIVNMMINIITKIIEERKNKNYKTYKSLITALLDLIDTHKRINNFKLDKELYPKIILELQKEIKNISTIMNTMLFHNDFETYRHLNNSYIRLVEKCDSLTKDLENQEKKNKIIDELYKI